MGTWNGLGCWEPGALITIRDDGKLNMLAVINGRTVVEFGMNSWDVAHAIPNLQVPMDLWVFSDKSHVLSGRIVLNFVVRNDGFHDLTN